MSSNHEDIANAVGALRREVQELTARLSQESSLRAATDASVAQAVGSIAEFIRGGKTAAADPR